MDEYEKVKKSFDEYYEKYKSFSGDIDHKYKHSYNVAKLMENLAKRLGLNEEDTLLAKEIGLLHDIGRFEQLKQTNSFRDGAFDHADYGVEYLFKENHIRDFIDDDKNDEIIAKAILYHNKYIYPDNLNEREDLFAKMIKDMDKTDIYYQLGVYYNNSFDEEVTPEVKDDFLNKRLVNKKNVSTKSDRVLCSLSFLYDYNFNESLDILVETDNFGFYISSLEVSKENEEFFREVVNKCYEKINEGV